MWRFKSWQAQRTSARNSSMVMDAWFTSLASSPPCFSFSRLSKPCSETQCRMLLSEGSPRAPRRTVCNKVKGHWTCTTTTTEENHVGNPDHGNSFDTTTTTTTETQGNKKNFTPSHRAPVPKRIQDRARTRRERRTALIIVRGGCRSVEAES